MMYILDWITCNCYMMLRKIHYADWDAKTSAIVNSGVIVGIFLIILNDLLMLTFFPRMLQTIYSYGKYYYISMIALAICGVFSRYYYFRKDAISLMSETFKGKRWNRGCFLFVVDICILIGSFALLFFVVQHVKSKGVIFG